jgi:hypothetical protein
MKLNEITIDQVKKICELAGEPFISFMVNNNGKWDSIGLEIQIVTTCTTHKSKEDSYIRIYLNGTIQLQRNSGDWGGCYYDTINGLAITDYLRK